jgi:hypothetical protein
VACTVSGSRTFSAAFAQVNSTGVVRSFGGSWTGTVTGTRYVATTNGVFETFGSGGSYFPGNASGTTATGGQYA